MKRKSVFVILPFHSIFGRILISILYMMLFYMFMQHFFKMSEIDANYKNIIFIFYILILYAGYKLNEKVREKIALSIFNDQSKFGYMRSIKEDEYLFSAILSSKDASDDFNNLVLSANTKDICTVVAWLDFYFQVIIPSFYYAFLFYSFSAVFMVLVLFTSRIILDYMIAQKGLSDFFKLK